MAEGIITRRGGGGDGDPEFFEAEGGIVTDQTINGIEYRLHTFTDVNPPTPSTFEVTATANHPFASEVLYAVVAGGGGGGGASNNVGTNGFGGESLFTVKTDFEEGVYPVSIGGGGPGGPTNGSAPAGVPTSVVGPSTNLEAQGGAGGQRRAFPPGAIPGEPGFTGGEQTIDITGTGVRYGIRGGGSTPNRGHGGVRRDGTGPGGPGGSGTVIFRYRKPPE